MANSVQYNLTLDPATKFVWNVSLFNDDDTPIDASLYQFKFVLKNAAGTIVWEVLNSQMTRPNSYTVQFEKPQSVISALATGQYTYKFLVTNSSVTDDEWVNGIATR